jgi:Flp pilus assembly secretin CpaC
MPNGLFFNRLFLKSIGSVFLAIALRDNPEQMAHLVQNLSPNLNSRHQAVVLPLAPVAEISDKENTMNRAEHSPQEHSAPHGAPGAATSTLSICGSELSNALAVSQPFPVLTGHRFMIRLSQRRSRSSGRALIALLALGLVLENSSYAHASSTNVWSSKLSLVASTRVAASNAARHINSGGDLSAALQSQLAEVALSKQTRLPVAPRAALMPRATAVAVPVFPQTSARKKVAANKATAPKIARGTASGVSRTVSAQQGSAKLLRVVQTVPSRATGAIPPAAPTAKVGFGGMKKVIDVPSLTLPPLSKPLPSWMQNAAVKVDKFDLPASKRIAQNPAAPPIRNPRAPVTNSDRLPNQIEVAVSTFVVLMTTTDLQTVAIADPAIADVAVVNSRTVLLNGKASGVTSLVIVDGQKIRQYTVRVTAEPGSRPIDVAAAIGLPGVTVRPIRNALVLEGEVANAEEARRAEEIAGIYSAKVINQTTIRGLVSPDVASVTQLTDLINIPGVTVRVNGETAILSGTVSNPQQIQDAETIARSASKNVINLLRLPSLTPDQIRESLGAVATTPTGSTIATPGQILTAQPLTIRESGGQIIVEGAVNTQAEADTALASAARSGLQVINRVQIRPAPTPDQLLTSQVAAAIGRPGVIVRGTAKRLVLEGTVKDTNEAVLCEQVARAFTTPVLGQVDNLLRTEVPVQCNVDISIVELNVTDSRNLGVQYGSVSLLGETVSPATATILRDAAGNPILDAAGNIQTALVGGVVNRTVSGNFTQGVASAGNGFVGGGSLQFLDPFRLRLNALVSEGKGRILSNPTTTVLSGRTATFQVGGQVPIPAASTVGANGSTTAIVFKDYGILLDIVPNALPNGNVTLRIRTEVSQPDFSTGVTPPGGGSAVPGFSRRSTVTEVTVPVNGTVALSGLITADDTRNETRVPLLSRLPIIGALFRSRDFRQNKTELVFFVKPRVLANPLAAGTDAFAGPVAVGENSNLAAQMGNPGLTVFNGGFAIGSGVAAQ